MSDKRKCHICSSPLEGDTPPRYRLCRSCFQRQPWRVGADPMRELKLDTGLWASDIRRAAPVLALIAARPGMTRAEIKEKLINSPQKRLGKVVRGLGKLGDIELKRDNGRAAGWIITRQGKQRLWDYRDSLKGQGT